MMAGHTVCDIVPIILHAKASFQSFIPVKYRIDCSILSTINSASTNNHWRPYDWCIVFGVCMQPVDRPTILNRRFLHPLPYKSVPGLDSVFVSSVNHLLLLPFFSDKDALDLVVCSLLPAYLVVQTCGSSTKLWCCFLPCHRLVQKWFCVPVTKCKHKP